MTKIKIDNKTYLINKNKDIKDELARLDIVDCYLLEYEDYHDETQEFVTQEIINCEDYQHLQVALINSQDSNYHTAERELTITDRYYQYRYTIADQVKKLIEEQEDQEFIYLDRFDLNLVNEYNQHVSNYNKFGELDKIEILQDKKGSKIKTNIEIGKND